MQDLDTVEFIREVTKRPVIWSSSHDKYKNKVITKKAWDELARIFHGVQVDDLKKKWKNLRDTYRKELKKYPKTSDPLRTDADETFESCWKYFSLMNFTKDEVKTLDTNATQEDESNEEAVVNTADTVSEDAAIDIKVEKLYFSDDEIVHRDTENVGPLRQEIKIENSQKSNENLHMPVNTAQEEDEDDTADVNTAETSKRTRPQDLREQYLEIERKKLKILEAESAQNNKSQDYHFLMSLLPEIQKLPILNKLRLRNKFNNILMEEIQSLNDASNS